MKWPSGNRDYQAISPLPTSECVAILSAMVEPFQWFGPWPLDTPFMGDVTQRTFSFSLGMKPYTWQPILRASIDPHPGGTVIIGEFKPRRIALWFYAGFMLVVFGSMAYAGGNAFSLPTFAVFGLAFIYEQWKARSEQLQMRNILAKALKIERPPHPF